MPLDPSAYRADQPLPLVLRRVVAAATGVLQLSRRGARLRREIGERQLLLARRLRQWFHQQLYDVKHDGTLLDEVISHRLLAARLGLF